MDNGETHSAIAKLSTDMEWVKQTLTEIKKSIDIRDRKLEDMINDMNELNSKRINDLDTRVKDLEGFKNWTKGALAGLGAVSFFLCVIEIMHFIG